MKTEDVAMYFGRTRPNAWARSFAVDAVLTGLGFISDRSNLYYTVTYETTPPAHHIE